MECEISITNNVTTKQRNMMKGVAKENPGHEKKINNKKEKRKNFYYLKIKFILIIKKKNAN